MGVLVFTPASRAGARHTLLIQQYLQKGKGLSDLPQKNYDRSVNVLNRRLLKRLHLRIPEEVFFETLNGAF
jgi:hypothetical protein